MSNWAEKYMKKQGWKETGGIGKTLQGRSEPVKECFDYSHVLEIPIFIHINWSDCLELFLQS